MLMKGAAQAGCFVSLENPAGSYLWKHPGILALLRSPEFSVVQFDQCMYGLRSPPGSEFREIWRKPTCLLSNFPDPSRLVRTCDGTHAHTQVFGRIKVHSKPFLRSKLAGHYPVPFCRALVALAAEACHAAG